jgi:hypothetical protein
MTADLKLLAEAFVPRAGTWVRVQPDGFRIGESTVPVLRATLASWTLVRKLFREDRLICHSENGEVSTGGKGCKTCRDRVACIPRLRILLEAATGLPPDANGCTTADPLGALVLEINATSCRNFLAHAQRMATADIEVPDLPVRMTVIHRGQWGEVCFAPDPDPITDV